MSQIINFYAGRTNSSGYSFDDIIYRWTDDQWEGTHDFIQWVFPLDEKSKHNVKAPVLTYREIVAFQTSNMLRQRMLMAFERFLSFVGLKCKTNSYGGVTIAKAKDFSGKLNVWSKPNHNWLSVTRVLKSLCLMGLDNHASALQVFVLELKTEGYPIEDETINHWNEAVL